MENISAQLERRMQIKLRQIVNQKEQMGYEVTSRQPHITLSRSNKDVITVEFCNSSIIIKAA